MMSGAAVLAVATTVTLTTADVVITPLMIGGEKEEEVLTVASPGDAAAAVMTWWTWRGIIGPTGVRGAGEMTMTTASCERPWRGRSWVSNRGLAAGTDWTPRATAQTGGGHRVDPHHSLWTRPLDTLVAVTTTHHLHLHHTVTRKVCHLLRKATSARWVSVVLNGNISNFDLCDRTDPKATLCLSCMIKE